MGVFFFNKSFSIFASITGPSPQSISNLDLSTGSRYMYMKESQSLSLCRDYLSPRIEVLSFSTEGFLCDSPEDGESEDVGYEDWS